MINAEVNGMKVNSNKSCTININGSLIMFGDGSWCDTRTGQVHNVGRGYIDVNGVRHEPGTKSAEQSKVQDKVTVGPRNYDASQLAVKDVGADVRIETHDRGAIEVTIVGPKDSVEAIRTRVNGALLILEGDGRLTGGNNISVTSSGSISMGSRSRFINIVSGGRGISIGGGNEPTTIVTIKVPVGTPIGLAGNPGDVRVGDTRGDLAVSVTGSGDVRAGEVRNATVEIRGSGDVEIDSVAGRADVSVRGSGDIEIDSISGAVQARINGSGDISINGGEISHLEVVSSGSGDVDIRTLAGTADLQSTGSGDITVKRVIQQPKTRESGSGEIRVKKIG